MYCDVEDFLDWLNKASRPKLAEKLRENLAGRIYGGLPDDKDKGQTLAVLLVCKNRYNGNPCYYVLFDAVTKLPGATKDRTEVYGERYLRITDMQELLHMHGVDLLSSVPRKHNERGAGRKPMPPDKIDAIRQCRENGMTVRATAKFLLVSSATVQKYSKE